MIALVVGLPLGAVAGRLAWRAISNSLGVATVQSLPLLAIATIAGLVLLVANIAASFAPGVSAARHATRLDAPRRVTLRELGIRLGGRQRQGEIAARIGGDEFALLMTNVASPTAAAVRAEQLLAVLREPLASVGFPLAIAASVGVSAWPDDGADAATLIQAADLAMYAAKRSGNSVQDVAQRRGAERGRQATLLAELQAGLAPVSSPCGISRSSTS